MLNSIELHGKSSQKLHARTVFQMRDINVICMICLRATESRAQQNIFWNYSHFSVKIAIFGRLEVG